ncbi:MAG: DNA polymerase I [Abditibacteriota bacterium]|nr:DNA polymerase I [Abditibacteriota bacterium]
MKKLLLLDGNSLLYRSYFATRELSTKDGFPTNALYGLCNMVTSILEKDAPDVIVAAFDTPAPTFRHKAYPEYKAQRKPPEDALVMQMQPARDILRAFGITVSELEGYEGDDIIGTLSVMGAASGMETHIYSGDLDTLQLVNGQVKVYHTVKGVSDMAVYDEERIKERYGIGAGQVVDFKGLKGDSSDNIPGVPGVGDKTAAKLICDYGSIAGLYENIDLLKKGKLKDSLIENRDKAYLSRSLAEINTEVPLDPDILKREYKGPDYPYLLELFKKYEFRSLLRTIHAVSPEELMPVSGAPEIPAAVAVDSETEFKRLKDTLEASDRIALYADDELRNISIYAGGRLWQLPVSRGLDLGLIVFDQPFMAEIGELKHILEDPDIKKTVYSAKALYKQLLAEKICLRGADMDLSLIAYLRDSTISALSPAEMWKEEYGAQAASNAFVVRALSEKLYGELDPDTKRLYEELELPLAFVLGDMELRGIEADRKALNAMSAGFEKDLEEISRKIYAAAGEVFNISSPKQLGEVLFGHMQIPYPKKGSARSTGEEILSQLVSEYPVCGEVLRYRELAKLKSTYADALAGLVDPKTGRIHTNFNQTVTSTGRLSSSRPNLQNIPVKTETGRQIRRAFVAAEGFTLISADYSQVEFRLLAHITRDPWLIEAFREGRDFHTEAAAGLFGVERSEVTPDMRRRAKTLNFAILYGMAEFTLAGQLGCSVKEAKEITEKYFARFPLVKKTTEKILADAAETGYVKTIMGRRRYVPEINSKNRQTRLAAERAAVNMPFQGSAADIIKKAMINLEKSLKNTDSKLLLQIHDELVVEAPYQKWKETAAIVKKEMESAYGLLVPLICDVKQGSSLGDMQPAEL